MKERRAIVLLIAFVILALFSVSLGYISDLNRKQEGGSQAIDSESSATGEEEAGGRESSAPGAQDAVTAATPNGGVPGASPDAVTSATSSSSSSGSYTPGTDTTTGATPATSPSVTPAPDTTTGPTPAPSTTPAPAPDTTTGPTPAPSPGTTPTEPAEPEEEGERDDDAALTIGWLPAGTARTFAAVALPAAILESRFNPFSLALFRIMYEIELRGGQKLARR